MILSLNGAKVYFQKTGRGKDLILLHGWEKDVSTFWPVVDQLKEDFTLWLIDLPGFGRSRLPKRAMSVADYAKLVACFIRKEHMTKPILLGHSLGGRIAIKLTAANSNLVDKLVLVSSAGIKPKQDNLKFLAYMSTKFIKFFIPNLFNLKKKARYLLYKTLESDYLQAGEMSDTLTNILDEDLTPELPKIKNKTLLIWGEKDKSVPISFGKRMYQLIPNARLEVYESVGHFPYLENPKLFVHHLKDFCL